MTMSTTTLHSTDFAGYRQLAAAVIARAVKDARQGDPEARAFLGGTEGDLRFWLEWLGR